MPRGTKVSLAILGVRTTLSASSKYKKIERGSVKGPRCLSAVQEPGLTIPTTLCSCHAAFLYAPTILVFAHLLRAAAPQGEIRRTMDPLGKESLCRASMLLLACHGFPLSEWSRPPFRFREVMFAGSRNGCLWLCVLQHVQHSRIPYGHT